MKVRVLAVVLGCAGTAFAQARVVPAEPRAPIAVSHPSGVDPVEAQVVVVLVVDAAGFVESALIESTLPEDLPDAYREGALDALRSTRFTPTTRDGTPIRSRIQYVVVFPPPAGARNQGADPAARTRPGAAEEAPGELPPSGAADEAPIEIEVRGAWLSPRGVGDVTVGRELLEAAPRQQSSELLSAAPGFFVDHENGEGLGNDIFLRGFDLEHGSGIELGVGDVPVNQPVHIQGQGYVDANFIIPEVVERIHVLQGPYDPRQGDAAIVGSAFFDLAVPDRGYHVATSYGSFDQARVLGIVAPDGMKEGSFAAFAVRRTDGFGVRRASRSGSANAQLDVDVGGADTLRILSTAYTARAELPGVVRADHVEQGLIGYYDSYPFFAENQGVQATRVLSSAEWQHRTPSGGRFDLSAWGMWTDFATRQNFAGAFETSRLNPRLAGLGDLFERTNEEAAFGARSSYKSAPLGTSGAVEGIVEPGVVLRVGRTEQSVRLLVPPTLDGWDRRSDARVGTLDAGGYVDADVRLFERLRIAGGVRTDVLAVSVDDRLASRVGGAPEALPGARRTAVGVAAGPRGTAELSVADGLAVSASYGEGFRSLDAASLEDGTTRPFSKVRSVEVGMRGWDPRRRYETTLSAFNTWVDNELVFVADTGGFETQSRSIRRGIVGSAIAKPRPWLLLSSALSVTDAFFQTNVPNIAKRVPSVPPLLYRLDATARRRVATVAGRPLTARAGAGYTLLSPLHLADDVRGPQTHILNVGVGLRYAAFELDLETFNLLDRQYADDANYYLSNWSFSPGQQPASFATHYQAAPPRTVLVTLSAHL